MWAHCILMINQYVAVRSLTLNWNWSHKTELRATFMSISFWSNYQPQQFNQRATFTRSSPFATLNCQVAVVLCHNAKLNVMCWYFSAVCNGKKKKEKSGEWEAPLCAVKWERSGWKTCVRHPNQWAIGSTRAIVFIFSLALHVLNITKNYIFCHHHTTPAIADVQEIR